MKSLFSKTMAVLLTSLLLTSAVQASPFLMMQELLGMGPGGPGSGYGNHYGYGPKTTDTIVATETDGPPPYITPRMRQLRLQKNMDENDL